VDQTGFLEERVLSGGESEKGGLKQQLQKEENMKSKKRYVWVVPVAALAVAALFVASHRSAAASAADENGGARAEAVTVGAATTG